MGLPKAYGYDGTHWFMDDLYAVQDHAKFLFSFKKIYSKKLELKVGNQGKHATFLDLHLWS